MIRIPVRIALIIVSLVVSTAVAAKCDTYSCELKGRVRKPDANTIDCLHGGQCKEDEGATELCCNVHCRTHTSGKVTLAVPRGTKLGAIECAYDLGVNENAKVCTGAKYFAAGCPTSTCLSSKPDLFCVNSADVALSAKCVWGGDSCQTCPKGKFYWNDKCQDRADPCPNEGEIFCGNDEESGAMYDKGFEACMNIKTCSQKIQSILSDPNSKPTCQSWLDMNSRPDRCYSKCTVGLTEVGNKNRTAQYGCTTDQEKEYLALVGSHSEFYKICHEPDRGDPNKYCGSDGGVGDITTLMYNEGFRGTCIDDATCPAGVFVEDSERTCKDWIAMNSDSGKCYATCSVGFSDTGIDAVMKKYGCTEEEITQYKSVNKKNKLYDNKLKGTSGACRSAGAIAAAATVVALIASVVLVE